jgi:nucleoside-diphosphate-sugar epimerase
MSGIVRIVMIGGSGHVGSFLVPRLVRGGHEVINLTRGVRAPYVDDEAWSRLRTPGTSAAEASPPKASLSLARMWLLLSG